MAWDLWSSTYDQVMHDRNYSEYFGWQCDFYFGCGQDVIEEDALNEKSCVQVLSNLIKKADVEIEELEKDLLSLQNELASAEHQNWPETCCSALTEKINWLDVSIRSLKNDQADNTEIQLLLQKDTIETLDEIVKAAQTDYCQDTRGQPPDVNLSKHAVDDESSNINSNILKKEEQNEVHAENNISSKLHVDLHIKRSDGPVKIETVNTIVKDSSPGSLELAVGHPQEEKILAVHYSAGNEEEETKEHIFASEDRLLNENVLMCPEEKRCNPEAEKELQIVVRSDMGAIICVPGPSDGTSLLGTSDFKVLGNEEVGRSQFITSDMDEILNSFSSEGKGNILNEAKQEANVKDVAADGFGLAAGIEGKKMCLDSQLHALQGTESESSDLDQKLCDFAPKTARRDWKKDFRIASIQNLDPMNLPSNNECQRATHLQVVATQASCLADPVLCSSKGRSRKNSLAVMNTQSPRLIHAKNSVLNSVLEMQTNSAFTGSQLTDEGKSASLCLQSVRQKNQGKRKLDSDSFVAGEAGNSLVDVTSNSSLKTTSKRRRKVTKRPVQDGQQDTEQYAIVPYDSKFSELQKRRNVSKFPVTPGILNSFVKTDSCDGVAMEIGNQETSALLPVSLQSLNMHKLRAIAKQHKMKQYYKLNKAPLVRQLEEHLAHRLGSC